MKKYIKPYENFIFIIWISVCLLMAMHHRIWQRSGLAYSVADDLLATNHILFLGFVYFISAIYFFDRITKEKMIIQTIVRIKRREFIWINKVKDVLIHAMTMSTLLITGMLLVSRIGNSNWVNWNRKNSVLYKETGVALNISIVQIFLIVWFTVLLKTVIVFLLCELGDLLWHNKFFMIVPLLAVCAAEFFWREGRIFFRLFSVTYKRWTTMNLIYITFLLGILISTVIIGAGIFIIRKADFYNV